PGLKEDPQRDGFGAQRDHRRPGRQGNLPSVHRELPTDDRLLALGQAERVSGDELERPGHRAADHAEPQDGVRLHSEGESWVNTTNTAKALTTYQYRASARTP